MEMLQVFSYSWELHNSPSFGESYCNSVMFWQWVRHKAYNKKLARRKACQSLKSGKSVFILTMPRRQVKWDVQPSIEKGARVFRIENPWIANYEGKSYKFHNSTDKHDCCLSTQIHYPKNISEMPWLEYQPLKKGIPNLARATYSRKWGRRYFW